MQSSSAGTSLWSLVRTTGIQTSMYRCGTGGMESFAQYSQAVAAIRLFSSCVHSIR